MGLLNYFAQQNILPVAASARVEKDRLIVNINQLNLLAHKANIIAEKMRRTVTVRSVLLSIKNQEQEGV
jgi:hypothetical protein